MMVGYGAEKDRSLHRADTGTPVRRKIQAERRGSPAGFGILTREYPAIIITEWCYMDLNKKRLGIDPSHAHQAYREHGWEGKMFPIYLLSTWTPEFFNRNKKN